MTLPVPGQPGETPEQRQARFAAADAVQARIDAERRAQLEAQANPVSRRLPEPVGIPMPVARPPVGIPVPITQPPSGGLTQAAPFDVAAAYRQHSQKLADAIKAGQITVERARQLQAPLFAATKLGSTPEGQAAMNAAAAQAQGGMPMSGYDAAAQYRNFGQELMGMIKSGALTVEQANALKAPVFNAVKLGNSNAGYQQMQAALNAARQQMGGQNMGITVKPVQPQETARRPYAILGMPTPQNGIAPQIKQQTPTQAQVDAYYASNPDMNNSYWNPYAGSFETRPQVSQPSAPQGVGGMGQSVNPVTPPQEIVVTGQRMPEPPRMPEIVAPPPMLQPPMPVMPPPPVVYDTFRPTTPPPMPPQAAVAQPASAPQGMAMGGLLRKYYGGGMC